MKIALPTQLQAKQTLESIDDVVSKPAVAIANHAAAVASLSYFGLISMSMMSMMQNLGPLSIRAAITKSVGTTSNLAFSQLFSTFVTPASFVFLIWPLIAALQLGTLGISILRPSKASGSRFSGLGKLTRRIAGPPMSQSELTALALANGFATFWLVTASNAVAGALPLASVLALPFVPLFSGLPLRSSTPLPVYRPLFQVFSAFTTIASFLALAVELQHGGRVAWFLGRAEPSACVFLGLPGLVVHLSKGQSLPKRLVNLLALSGILAKRLAPIFLATTSAAAGLGPLLTSPSFYGTVGLWCYAVQRLVGGWWRRRGSKGGTKKATAPAKSQGETTTRSSDGPGFGQRGTFF